MSREDSHTVVPPCRRQGGVTIALEPLFAGYIIALAEKGLRAVRLRMVHELLWL